MRISLKTTGLVIRKKLLSDRDYLLTFISPSLGKINAVAPGATSIKSRRIGHIDVGTLSDFELHSRGEDSMPIVVSCKNTRSHSELKRSLSASATAMNLLSVLDTRLPLSFHVAGVFPLIKKVFLWLETKKTLRASDIENLILVFTMKFETLLGNLPALDEAVCTCDNNGNFYILRHEPFALLCERCAPLSKNSNSSWTTQSIMRMTAIQKSSFARIMTQETLQSTISECGALLSQLLEELPVSRV